MKRLSKAGAAARAMILPLALTQFIASYAATNMNVAISAIAKDLGTTVAASDRDHAVHADDGGADDPGQQAHGPVGPQRCFTSACSFYGVGGLWRPCRWGCRC